MNEIYYLRDIVKEGDYEYPLEEDSKLVGLEENTRQ